MILAGETSSIVQESLSTCTSFRRRTMRVCCCLALPTSRLYISTMVVQLKELRTFPRRKSLVPPIFYENRTLIIF